MCVTSILVAVRQNTGFPVPFASGAAEAIELYELSFEEFKNSEWTSRSLTLSLIKATRSWRFSTTLSQRP
jgi:hypothetical protein